MKLKGLFITAAPWRGVLEGWLLGAVLLIPLFPVLLDSTHFARSLYLVLLPLICAFVTALRVRFFSQRSWLTVIKECGMALLLALGITGIVLGLFAGSGQWDAIRYSYAGTTATRVFLLLSGFEYLGMRWLLWGGRQWNQLRRRHYVWGLTHVILSVVGGLGLIVLIGFTLYLTQLFHNDIWAIPAESFFAQTVFWISLILTLAFLLLVLGVIIFLPGTLFFSFLAARRVTARLESLAMGTQALRAGNLSTRLDVKGEDEVAQLQANFNAMAADLEASVLDLQVEKAKVEQLLQARRDLVAGISHELRNPTAIILGYSDSLRRNWQERSPEEVSRDLDTIQYEASRLKSLLNDLLTTSQAEAGHLRVELQSVEVVALARRVVETFRELAWSSKKVQVMFSGSVEEIQAWADPLRLEQVLVNLVQNAVRHTSPGGVVAVEIQPGKVWVSIEVEDTGEGISPEALPYIWEKYYQAGTQPATYQRAGLGLSLVKELTEAMGGTVSVESQPGEGSVFRLRLPVPE